MMAAVRPAPVPQNVRSAHPQGAPVAGLRPGRACRSPLQSASTALSRTAGARRHFRRVVCPVANAIAEPPASVVNKALPIADHHRELRQKIIDGLPAGGVIYMEGGDLVHRNGMDVFYDFRPDSDFFYLTGCKEPGFAAMIDTSTGKFTLFSARIPDAMLHWVGALPSLEDQAEEYGADECHYLEDAPAILMASGATAVHSLPGKIGESVIQAIGNLDLRPNEALLPGALQKSREFKTASEVACLRYASDISSEAHLAVMQAAPSSRFEYELEGVFINSTRGRGLRHMGYPAIIGAGKNSAVLHYDRNDQPITPGGVVLMDAGAEFRCYTADITRTFPAAAKFDAAMGDVYDAVLAVQELALAEMGPGVSWKDVSMKARHLTASLLRDLGLVRGSPEDIVEAELDRLFMPHGLGHFLGLDVHDVGSGGSPVPTGDLKPGHVVTCEPGIYFVESLLRPALNDPEQSGMLNGDRIESMFALGGVRIEDNVHITESGTGNLTTVAKSRAEVEAIAASAITQ